MTPIAGGPLPQSTATIRRAGQLSQAPNQLCHTEPDIFFELNAAYPLGMTDKVSDAPATVVEHETQPRAPVRDEPVALSFPSILRNPNFAHLNVHSVAQRQVLGESASAKKKTPRDKEGKRRIRRSENSK
jgi:hypothetical protein